MARGQRRRIQVTATWATLAVLAVVVAGGVLHWSFRLGPSGGSDEPDPVVISRYVADFDVAADGTLTAVETIDAQFPDGRHGIYRFWDETDPSDGSARYPVTVLEVTRDGQPEQMTLSSVGTFVIARIGDPDVLLAAGQHRYVLRYSVPDVLRPVRDVPTTGASTDGARTGDERSVFAWWVVAPHWELPILAADMTVRLPSTVTQGLCRTPDNDGCTVAGAGTATLTVTAAALPPRTGVEVAAYSAAAATPGPSVPWDATWDRWLGTDAAPLLLLLVLSAAAGVLGAGLSLRAREKVPAAPIVYEPPRGLGPVQCEYLLTETTGHRALTATVLHLADRGAVVLEDHEVGRWTVRVADPSVVARLDPVAQAVADALDLREAGGSFTTTLGVSAGTKVGEAVSGLEAAVTRWADTGMWRPDRVTQSARVAVVVSLVLAGVLGFLTPILVGLPFAVFAVCAAPLFATGMARRRTPEAREAWMQAAGFRRFLSTPSSEDRFDFAARGDLWIAYVPYAVAFGVGEAWAARYHAAVGHEPPAPTWYASSHAPVWTSSGGFGDFDAAIASSVAVAAAEARASSGGGFGGGGFGGGGGGGGGSW